MGDNRVLIPGNKTSWYEELFSELVTHWYHVQVLLQLDENFGPGEVLHQLTTVLGETLSIKSS